MRIKTFSTKSSFIKAATSYISKICLPADRHGLPTKRRVNIALSGGSTPQPIYKALSKIISTADNIHFYQVDERYVPEYHPDSSQKMIRTTLKPENFHHFDTSLPITKALKKYSREIFSKNNKPLSFDLCILGIGPDGHTASLFPNSKALTTKKPLAHTTTKNFPVHDRLTITFPVILKSKKLLVLLKGADKKAILEKLQKNSGKTKSSNSNIKNFPALKLLEHRNLQILFLPVDTTQIQG